MIDAMKRSETAERKIVWTAWILSVVVVALAVIAWGQALGWRLGAGWFGWFPLLGLVAFSLMWTHYIIGALRRMQGVARRPLGQYFKITSYVVLVALLLHPGILILQLWQKGYGPPPESYLEYVGPSLRLYVVFGTVSLLAFLAFELHRKFAKASWWPVVVYAGDVAMVLIVLHGLKLGSNLQAGWYRFVWIFYAVSLLLAIAYTRTYNEQPKVGSAQKS
jgi:hypothetical protein